MILDTIIFERFDNFFTDEQKNKYIDQIWDILQSSYKDIGGIKGSGLNSKEDMIKNIPMIKVYREGDVIKVVFCYKDKDGRKKVAIGTDGSFEAKRMLIKMLKEEYSTGRSWGEVSDKVLHFMRKFFTLEELEKYAIDPADIAKKLPNDNITLIGNKMYTREIGGNQITKMGIGNPNAPSIKYKKE